MTAYYGPDLNIGLRTWIKRCILCVLQPLTGGRASGTALVKATGADVVLRRGAYAVPALEGASARQTDHMRLVKVATQTTVTGAGVSVPIISAMGGELQNLDAGTKLRWTPAIQGLEPICTVESLTGATTLTIPGSLRRIAMLDKLGISKANVASDLFRTRIGAFPAAVLAWTGAARGEAVATDARMRKLRFRLFIVTNHSGSAEERTEEVDAILDYVEATLEGRSAVDNEIFADPPIAVGNSGVFTADDGSYVHFIDFDLSTTVTRIEHRTFVAWLETQTQYFTDPTPEYPAREDAIKILDLQQTQ